MSRSLLFFFGTCNGVVGIVFGIDKKKCFGPKRCRFGIEEKLGCVAFGYVFGIDVTFLTNSGCCGENEYFGQKLNFERQANTNTKRQKQSGYFFLTNNCDEQNNNKRTTFYLEFYKKRTFLVRGQTTVFVHQCVCCF